MPLAGIHCSPPASDASAAVLRPDSSSPEAMSLPEPSVAATAPATPYLSTPLDCNAAVPSRARSRAAAIAKAAPEQEKAPAGALIGFGSTFQLADASQLHLHLIADWSWFCTRSQCFQDGCLHGEVAAPLELPLPAADPAPPHNADGLLHPSARHPAQRTMHISAGAGWETRSRVKSTAGCCTGTATTLDSVRWQVPTVVRGTYNPVRLPCTVNLQSPTGQLHLGTGPSSPLRAGLCRGSPSPQCAWIIMDTGSGAQVDACAGYRRWNLDSHGHGQESQQSRQDRAGYRMPDPVWRAKMPLTWLLFLQITGG